MLQYKTIVYILLLLKRKDNHLIYKSESKIKKKKVEERILFRLPYNKFIKIFYIIFSSSSSSKCADK